MSLSVHRRTGRGGKGEVVHELPRQTRATGPGGPRYREAGHPQKAGGPDEVVAGNGHLRKVANRLAPQPGPEPAPIRRPREPRYGPAVREALRVAWTAANA